MQQIFSNTTLTVNQLIEKIDTGELGLPELQRPFIWKDSKVRDLFDSMMRGYPIGYLMLWECPSLDKKKSIGVDAHSYDTPKEVIIDGQQRLTSLYAVMKGKKVINSKFDEKSIVISYCPLQNKFEVGYQATKNDPEWIYNISDLFTSTNTFKFIGDFIKRLGDYSNTLIVLYVPANSIGLKSDGTVGLVARADRPEVIDLSIACDTLIDRRSGVDFKPFVLQRLPY